MKYCFTESDLIGRVTRLSLHPAEFILVSKWLSIVSLKARLASQTVAIYAVSWLTEKHGSDGSRQARRVPLPRPSHPSSFSASLMQQRVPPSLESWLYTLRAQTQFPDLELLRFTLSGVERSRWSTRSEGSCLCSRLLVTPSWNFGIFSGRRNQGVLQAG